MSSEPFAIDDDDRTILRPNFRSHGRHAAENSMQEEIAQRRSGAHLLPGSGINPLEKAASRLLPLVFTIRHSVSHPNPGKLRNQLIQQLDEFKQSANHILNDHSKVTKASYVMCSVLDDAVMNTPWGNESNWSQHNLLATFHDEVIGGERFFEMLKSLARDPRENIELLELMYLCLSLGYEGRYRIVEYGQNKLLEIRMWLFEIIRDTRSIPDKSLSLHWLGSGIKESQLPRKTILWVIAAAALALSSLVYMDYRYLLGTHTEKAIASFFSITSERLEVNSIAAPISPPDRSIDLQGLNLTQLLAPQIALKEVEVIDSHDEGKIRILGDSLFASGRTQLSTEFDPLVQLIAAALDQYKGSILVTGHTDNVPIRTGRFSSNLELSQQRASSVAELLKVSLTDPSRVTAEGRGSLQPIADNDSASGRAFNRRVEISIFY